MPRIFALLLLCVPAISAGAPEQKPRDDELHLGESRTFDLLGSAAVSLTLDVRGPVRITVRNLGRDTILTIRETGGERLLRAAGWRGPEHYYVATLDLMAPVTLAVAPDDSVSPAGQFGIRVDRAPADESLLAAERAMTRAADRTLSGYFGEGDTRQEALADYQRAAASFRAAGDRRREADAYFEAANVSDALCERQATLQQLQSAAAIWSSLGDERSVAATENLRGLVHWQRGEYALASPLFESAANRRKRLEDGDRTDAYFYAEAINNLGLVQRDSGDAILAMQYFREALQIWQGDVDLLNVNPEDAGWTKAEHPPWLHHALTAINNLGWANEVFGDIEESQRIWTQALALSRHRQVGDMAARIQNNLGNLERRTGNMREAMDLLESALSYFSRESPDVYWSSLTHFNIAQVYRDLGDDSRALESLQSSLALRTPECDPVGRAETLHEIGAIELERGQVTETFRNIADAEALLEGLAGNELTSAALTNLAGRAYYARRDYATALAEQDRAVKLYRAASDRLGEVKARTDRAMVTQALGRNIATTAELKTALQAAEHIDATLEQFRILTRLGVVDLDQGNSSEALRYAQAAINLSENVRRRLVRPILLREFSAVQREAFDVAVGAHIELGSLEDAWQAADEAHARRFIDVIRQSSFDIKALNAQQADRYEYLLGAIALLAENRTMFLSRNELAAADIVYRQLLPLLDEVDALQQQARRSVARATAPVTLQTVRSQLGDGDRIVEYYVGGRASGVWTIDKRDISFRSLQPVEAIRHDVESVIRAIRERQMPPAKELSRLSRALLTPADRAGEAPARLIVVPDGWLHYLPFSLLSDPASGFQEPLLARSVITYLPSVAALLELRSRAAGEGEGIAILADPVFSPDDPRIKLPNGADENAQLALLEPELQRGAQRAGIGDLPRLRGSSDEAKAIRAAAGSIDVLTLQGTEANRDVVLSGKLNRYDILHFATHGILDDEEPALSGLVLSGFSADGAVRKRFLRSQDIAGLDLKARLVVLSGCETGVGRLVDGEGLLALSRAFFYAGANQVVSTLWQVPDIATGELMAHFYEALLQEKLSAPAALRQAQLALRQTSRWRNPYYWAPFIVEGDWSPPARAGASAQ